MAASKTILVVDDNQVNRHLLNKILSPDYDIIEAENGEIALSILREKYESISVVLLDIVMPVLDGYEVLKQMHEDAFLSMIPVIVASGQDSDDAEMRALSLGANDYIVKPYKPDIIKHRISNTIYLRETAAFVNSGQHDPLTGLYGKEYFYMQVKETLQNNPDKQYDIVCSDIEHFKLVNDMFGMATGDALLCHFADMLKDLVQGFGICARLSGDIFACCIEHREDYDPKMFEMICERFNQFPIAINLSICHGIFVVDDRTVSPAAACDRACLAADTIKGKYGTDYAYYDDSIRQRLINDQFILDHMKPALEQEQFVVYYQPKYNINNNKVAGAEALVRWVHPEKGFLSPGDFIPLFEKNGFITKLDYYVWEKTCAQIRQWMDRGYPGIPISVNVSRVDIYNPQIAEMLVGLLEKYDLAPELLHLEITETAYTENPKQIIEVVSELKRFGFIIEMDDFGTGYSSLNMLSELPIDVLKLDMSFIQNEVKKEGSKSILSFIVSLAKWMNLLVVAEGVETQEQIDSLRNMECTYVQGYYFARPMSADAFETLLKESEIEIISFKEHHYTFDFHVQITPNSKTKKKMVVVDDIALHRHILKEVFSSYYTVVEANNGGAALKYIQENASDIEVILLDLMMPIVDGFQVLEVLKRDPALHAIPIIITSQSGDSSEERALDMGADDFIAKPYATKVLIHHVQTVVAFAHMKRREKERLERLELSQEMYQDYLTGALNRRGFDKAVEQLEVDQENYYALYMMDVDNLKKCNDTYGHPAGDALLRSFVEFVKNSLRSDDVFARIGGDEFMILTKKMPSKEVAFKKGQKLCRSEDWKCSACGKLPSCSIGVVVFQDGSDMAKRIAMADKALYAAKRNGKAQCVLWKSELLPLPIAESIEET